MEALLQDMNLWEKIEGSKFQKLIGLKTCPSTFEAWSASKLWRMDCMWCGWVSWSGRLLGLTIQIGYNFERICHDTYAFYPSWW